MSRTMVKRSLRRAPGAYAAALSVAKAFDIRTGRWAEPELGLVRAAVRPGETAVDVGANYGLWSYHLAKAGARVYAFEPIPQTAAVARRVLRMLGAASDVDLTTAACGERHETVTFRLPVAQDSGAFIGPLAHVEGVESRTDHPTMKADMVRLDDVPIAGDVALVKVDVEGAELFALRGAERLLRDHRPIVVCEVGSGLLRERYGIDPAELVAFMGGLGYEILRFDGVLRPADLTAGHDGNYVLVPEARRGRLAGLR